MEDATWQAAAVEVGDTSLCWISAHCQHVLAAQLLAEVHICIPLFCVMSTWLAAQQHPVQYQPTQQGIGKQRSSCEQQ